ncbi:MAG TPA: Asp-tRNA(Asn)/Glu-tRNA(Gln) amidotransferase subunit GatB [Tepidiformaceae bacterium]|nr:Asp-tRNA(Asn)/Glu-tRNA(Gln) amidotransferase subunit GatB [Tepidiformaceae bacterium]
MGPDRDRALDGFLPPEHPLSPRSALEAVSPLIRPLVRYEPRAWWEEDTARLLHRTDPVTGESYTLVDINRSGTPLMEIVSEPDMRSPAEAREYLVRLRQILRYIGVSEANMEEGNFRCDANVSLRPVGSTAFGTKVEIKNMNSFRAVHDAIAFEEVRQAAMLDRGERIIQETRGWVDERNETVSQRTKEHANDYRYFPEPDLPPLKLGEQYVARVRAKLPELPQSRFQRFVALGISAHDAEALTEARERADYFEAVAKAINLEPRKDARLAANWVLGEVGRWLNAHGREIETFPLAAEQLAGLARLVDEGKVTSNVGKEVFEQMVESGRSAAEIIESAGLAQISGEDELLTAVRGAIAANPKAVADYRGGKTSTIMFLVGQVMRETRGRANAGVVQALLEKELNV